MFRIFWGPQIDQIDLLVKNRYDGRLQIFTFVFILFDYFVALTPFLTPGGLYNMAILAFLGLFKVLDLIYNKIGKLLSRHIINRNVNI